MAVPYSTSEDKLTNAAGPGAGGFYGATDATQEAYDRYIHEPYEKPVRFDQLPANLGEYCKIYK